MSTIAKNGLSSKNRMGRDASATELVLPQSVQTSWPDGGLPGSNHLHRLSVVQYHHMIETGVLTAGDRLELLRGLMVCKMPHSPVHDSTVSIAHRRLTKVLPKKWIIRIQSAITLQDSEPEPDLVLAAGPEERYFANHPTTGDIGLAIEVSDASLRIDQQVKSPIYAQAEIPFYWIINLRELCVEVYSQPQTGASPSYRHRETYGLKQAVPLILAGRKVTAIAVGDLFVKTGAR